MDMTITPTTGTVRNWPVNPFRNLVSLIGAVREHRRRARTAAELEALPDHLLKDIGLHRSELLSAAMGDPSRRRSAAAQGE